MPSIDVAGIALHYTRMGSGPLVLFLHPEHFCDHHGPFIEQLTSLGEVITPRHPGFDGRPPPSKYRSVDDLAYLYLDLLDSLDVRDVLIVGSSLGGLGHLLMMAQGGHLSHEDTVANLTLFSREVLPRLEEL